MCETLFSRDFYFFVGGGHELALLQVYEYLTGTAAARTCFNDSSSIDTIFLSVHQVYSYFVFFEVLGIYVLS